MPQPISKVAPNANIMIGNVGDYPMQRHPELALLVAEVIVSWANVESFLLNLFIELMGGPNFIESVVASNTIGGNLQCFDNIPEADNFPFGLNTVMGDKEGECEFL